MLFNLKTHLLALFVAATCYTMGGDGFTTVVPSTLRAAGGTPVELYGGPHDDNHADQMNPNNDAYWDSRGGYDDDGWDSDQGYGGDGSQADLDNHADQMNPNNDAYWDSRGN